MAWHLAGTIIIMSFLVLGNYLTYPYIDPDYNSPLIYLWGYCNLSNSLLAFSYGCVRYDFVIDFGQITLG